MREVSRVLVGKMSWKIYALNCKRGRVAWLCDSHFPSNFCFGYCASYTMNLSPVPGLPCRKEDARFFSKLGSWEYEMIMASEGSN